MSRDARSWLTSVESADTRFGSTGAIPFNSSQRLHLCTRAEQSVRYNNARVSKAHATLHSMGGDNITAEYRRQLPDATFDASTSTKAHQWALKGLPACWNDCNHPTVCVQTGDCQCVRPDHCAPRRINPLQELYKYTFDSSSWRSPLGFLSGNSPALVNAVEKGHWTDMLLPEAREYLYAHPEFIKVYIVDGYPGQEEVEAADCHRILSTHCFSADNVMYRAMRTMASSYEDADLVVLPVYQHCNDVEFMMHDVFGWARLKFAPDLTLDGGNKTVNVVLTHDWGVCIHFAW